MELRTFFHIDLYHTPPLMLLTTFSDTPLLAEWIMEISGRYCQMLLTVARGG
jgi:hypothetical protein